MSWCKCGAALNGSVFACVKDGVIIVNLDELLLNINDVSFASAVCQSDIQTESDKQIYHNRQYNIALTESEFKDKFPGIDPGCVYYIPSFFVECFYFNQESLAVCPFHMDLLLNGFANITPADINKAISDRESAVTAGDYLSSITSLPDRMKLEYFAKLVQKKGPDIPNLYSLFFDIYTDSDYGFSGMDTEILQTIFNSKTTADAERTASILKNLPDTITIYRGGNTASVDYHQAYSWTLDVNVANFFACRRGKGTGYIAEAEVNKEDIIEAFLDERREQEIIVDPTAIRITRETVIQGMELLEDTLPKVAPLYREYASKMYGLDFKVGSEFHGKSHEARVLLLTQIISELEGLPLYERRLLAEAAIYHDTQRVDDDDDAGHGKAASKYYHDHEVNPNYLVEFLCKFHCLPDDQGYTEIQNNPKLRRNKSQTTRLYQIFKDADGLDRIRLSSLRELDLKQLRLPVSKGLTLVARICLEQVKA